MKVWTCRCQAVLFFDNTTCVSCAKPVGWCEACEAMVDFEADGDAYVCPAGHRVFACSNLQKFNVCNRYRQDGPGLCGTCSLNRVVPDLSVASNRSYWAGLEAAKRRMLYDLSIIGLALNTLPRSRYEAQPLVFDFKADSTKENGRWRPLDTGETVYTGHDQGLIVINVKEADPLERETMRINLGEPQRSLVGHFRHEIGHYFWDLLIRDDPERASVFIQQFGDPNAVPYPDALEAYYQNGPPNDWPQNHVSAYATMHPWEDWAETWTVYLNLASTLDTLNAHGWATFGPPFRDFDAAVKAYRQAAVVQNELTRDRGQLPLIPEVLAPPVIEKLRLIHRLVSQGVRA